MDGNQQVKAIAYRRAVAKLNKIKELEITPDIDIDGIDAIIEFLARKSLIEMEEIGKHMLQVKPGMLNL